MQILICPRPPPPPRILRLIRVRKRSLLFQSDSKDDGVSPSQHKMEMTKLADKSVIADYSSDSEDEDENEEEQAQEPANDVQSLIEKMVI